MPKVICSAIGAFAILLATSVVTNVATTSGAYAQDLPQTTVRVIGPWSRATAWKLNVKPFFGDTLPKLSKGKINVDC